MKAIACRDTERQRACNAAQGFVVRGHGIANRLRAAAFVLMGIAVLYGAWWPFVQATGINVQFTAAVAVADSLLQEFSLAPGSVGHVPLFRW